MVVEEQRGLLDDIKRLKDAGVAELQRRYREVFGEEPRSRHREFLWKRIAWRLQANAEGDLTERAQRKATELANDLDLRIRAPKDMMRHFGGPSPALTVVEQVAFHHDPRVPMPGTLLSREFRGRRVEVMVLHDGFEYGGDVYKTLSAAAKAATGTQWNGFDFFGLKKGRK